MALLINMKRLYVYPYILFVVALPVQAEEKGLQLEQLPLSFSLRTLNKVCQQPGLREELAKCYTSSVDGVQKMQRKLRGELRAHMLSQSLALEKKMAFFYAHRTFPRVYFPDSCPKLSDAAWTTIHAQQQAMQQTEEHLRTTVALRWRENMRLLLRVSYELMFIKHILRGGHWTRPRSRNWQHPPFWSRDVGRIKLLGFPPIYPIDVGKMEFGYPHQRLSYLYEKFPLLRWRGMRHFDIHGKTLDHKIFDLAFVNGHHDNVRQRLEFDFARKLRMLMASVDRFSNDVGEMKIKTIKNKEIVLNKGQIQNLRALQFYFMFEFHNDIDEYIDKLSENTLNAVARLVDRTYIDWTSTQQEVRDNACHGRDFEIEEYRSVLWSLLNTYTKQDSLDLLAAFCHPSWARTEVRLTEAWLQATYGALFAAGILVEKIRPTAVPLAAMTAAASFLMRSVRGVKSLQLERALLMIDQREEDSRIYNNIFNILAIPVSFWGLTHSAYAIANNSWRFFVPFYGVKDRKSLMLSLDFISHIIVGRYADAKSHLDRNINPLTSKNFMLNSLDNMLGASVKARALDLSDTMASRFKNTGIMSATYALFNIYVQNMYFLFSRDDITIENHKFNNLWGMFHSGPRNVVDWTLWHYLYGKVKRRNIPTAALVVGLMNVGRFIDGWQKKTWYANSKLSYLKEDMSFREALIGISLDDYLEPWRIAPVVNDELKHPSLKEIKSLQALLDSYTHKEEKTHLLIDIERFYQEALPAE